MHLKIERIWPRYPAFLLRSFLPRRLLGGDHSFLFWISQPEIDPIGSGSLRLDGDTSRVLIPTAAGDGDELVSVEKSHRLGIDGEVEWNCVRCSLDPKNDFGLLAPLEERRRDLFRGNPNQGNFLLWAR